MRSASTHALPLSQARIAVFTATVVGSICSVRISVSTRSTFGQFAVLTQLASSLCTLKRDLRVPIQIFAQMYSVTAAASIQREGQEYAWLEPVEFGVHMYMLRPSELSLSGLQKTCLNRQSLRARGDPTCVAGLQRLGGIMLGLTRYRSCETELPKVPAASAASWQIAAWKADTVGKML